MNNRKQRKQLGCMGPLCFSGLACKPRVPILLCCRKFKSSTSPRRQIAAPACRSKTCRSPFKSSRLKSSWDTAARSRADRLLGDPARHRWCLLPGFDHPLRGSPPAPRRRALRFHQRTRPRPGDGHHAAGARLRWFLSARGDRLRVIAVPIHVWRVQRILHAGRWHEPRRCRV